MRSTTHGTTSPVTRTTVGSRSALTGAKLAAALKLPAPVVDAISTAGSDGRPTAVTFTTATGVVKKFSARDLRQRLALRSTSFRLGMLRLESSRTAPDAPFRLEGVARDVDEPWLERLAANGSWIRARRVTPRVDGTFRVLVRPGVTTIYRLTGTGVAGPSLTITVAEAPA